MAGKNYSELSAEVRRLSQAWTKQAEDFDTERLINHWYSRQVEFLWEEMFGRVLSTSQCEQLTKQAFRKIERND